MAIKIYEQFAPFANPADGDYPYGSIKNDSIPGAEDGTPLDADWANDYAGFDAELFAQADIVPSGQPDKLGASQRLEALKRIAGSIAHTGDGRNVAGAHDAIYSRNFDTISEMIASCIVGGYATVGSISYKRNADTGSISDFTKLTDFNEKIIQNAHKLGSLLRTNLKTTKPVLFAHRGLGYTEQNTISDYSYALANGADGLEIDVRITSDGVPVMYHDDDLNTITDGSGDVKDLTLAVVQAARFPSLSGTMFVNERIPKLTELLDLVKDTGAQLIYEVKGFRTTADIDTYVQLVMDYGLEDYTHFASFSLSEVQQMVAYNNDINILQYVTAPTEASYDALAQVNNTRGKVLAANFQNINQSLVDYGRSLGVATACWTITSETSMRNMRRLGINMIITDVLSGNFKGDK